MLGELLGFMVLSGPVFLLVLWLPICIWLAWKFTKRFKTLSGRLPASVVVFVLLMVAPVADDIIGRTYFNHLCATEAGVRIYKTVELPADYWDEKGAPKFLEENGNFHLGKSYPVVYNTGARSSFLRVDNLGFHLTDSQSGELLGQATDFMYWGGWVRRNLSPHNTADSCGDRAERFRSLIQQCFIPTKR